MFRFLSKLYALQNLLARVVASISPVVFHNIGKYIAIKEAFYLTSLEQLEGEYVEFGVFTGSSMQCAMEIGKRGALERKLQTNYFGFDSFEGFGLIDSDEAHPFYTDINFKTSFGSVQRRINRASRGGNGKAHLVKGFFNETLKGSLSDYGISKIRIMMIDTDTYSSALTCLRASKSYIQCGTVMILDDAFSYKGRLDKGVAGAFNFWLKENPSIHVRKVRTYGMTGEILIVDAIND